MWILHINHILHLYTGVDKSKFIVRYAKHRIYSCTIIIIVLFVFNNKPTFAPPHISAPLFLQECFPSSLLVTIQVLMLIAHSFCPLNLSCTSPNRNNCFLPVAHFLSCFITVSSPFLSIYANTLFTTATTSTTSTTIPRPHPFPPRSHRYEYRVPSTEMPAEPATIPLSCRLICWNR